MNGGVNISSVSFMPRIREGKQIGPSFGLTARYISEKYFSMICGIQMELNYSQRGWKEVYEDETGDTYHRAMNYLELPILAHLAFGKDEGNGLRFIVNLGPQFGYLLNEKETFNWASERTGEQYGKWLTKTRLWYRRRRRCRNPHRNRTLSDRSPLLLRIERFLQQLEERLFRTFRTLLHRRTCDLPVRLEK